MSQTENIQLHKQVLEKIRTTVPIGSNQRLALFSRSIQGILRAKSSLYNDHHFEG